MTKKQIQLIKDLILFSIPMDDYIDCYRYVVKDLLKEIDPATQMLKSLKKRMKK